jgi:hypothetical protein
VVKASCAISRAKAACGYKPETPVRSLLSSIRFAGWKPNLPAEVVRVFDAHALRVRRSVVVSPSSFASPQSFRDRKLGFGAKGAEGDPQPQMLKQGVAFERDPPVEYPLSDEQRLAVTRLCGN